MRRQEIVREEVKCFDVEKRNIRSGNVKGRMREVKGRKWHLQGKSGRK